MRSSTAIRRTLEEAIVGYRDDPVVGPLVMVGAGGTLAELYNDVVLRLAPVVRRRCAQRPVRRVVARLCGQFYHSVTAAIRPVVKWPTAT